VRVAHPRRPWQAAAGPESGGALEFARMQRIGKARISLSDETDHAVAFVTLEK
jgi:phosphopantetheinyl transferase (holo-ACP synthase)